MSKKSKRGQEAEHAAVRLESAPKGGKKFADCTLYKNSEKALTIKRLANKQQANEILAMKAHLLSQNNDHDRGDSNCDAKKAKREREQAERAKPGNRPREATDADKQGDI